MTTETAASAHAALLADLNRRAGVAMDAAWTAADAGDEAKQRRAVERWYQRLAQITYVERWPKTARCPVCQYGESGWPRWAVLEDGALWACLEHWHGWRAEVAAKMADWGGTAREWDGIAAECCRAEEKETSQ